MDPQQFNRAVQRYGDMVFKIVMVIVRDPDEAQDAVQDTFFRYYRKAPAFESEQHEKAWLIRCATNTAKSQRTSAQHHRHEELHASIAVDAPESRVLTELLFFLPVSDRIILQLRYVEGYSAKEISRILGQNSAAIRKRLERARARARAVYEQEFI